MVGQMKQITKATSNYHPNSAITNARIHMNEEGKASAIDAQESEVGKIERTLGNSVIPHSWCNPNSSQHQERIGDYLLYGQGIMVQQWF